MVIFFNSIVENTYCLIGGGTKLCLASLFFTSFKIKAVGYGVFKFHLLRLLYMLHPCMKIILTSEFALCGMRLYIAYLSQLQ